MTASPSASLGTSDHLSINGTITSSPPKTISPTFKQSTWSWNWAPECIEALRQSLNAIPLLPTESNQDYSCESLWTIWRNNLLQRAHIFCTRLHPQDHCQRPQPPQLRRPWMSASLLAQITLKHTLFRQYTRQRDADSWTAFTRQRNLTTSLIRQAKSQFVLNATTSSFPNSQSDNSYLSTASTIQDNTPQNSYRTTDHVTHVLTNEQQQNTPNSPHTATEQPADLSTINLHRMMKCIHTQQSTTIPDLQYNNKTLTSPTDKATALNNFFISENKISIQKEHQSVPRIHMPRVSSGFLSSIQTTSEEVEKLLRALDTTKSPGGDDIPTRLLKEVSHEVSSSLAQLFNISFSNGELPQMWREATITPLHKKDQKHPRRIPPNLAPQCDCQGPGKISAHKTLQAHRSLPS